MQHWSQILIENDFVAYALGDFVSSRSYKKGLALVKNFLSEYIESCRHDIEPSNYCVGLLLFTWTEAYFLILY